MVTAPIGIVLLRLPLLTDVTLTVTVQLPPAGMVPPDNENAPAPATAETEPPAQVVPAPVGLATKRVAGRLSVNAAPVRALPLELLRVTVRTETPPPGIVAGANAFVPVSGDSAVTDRVALAGVPFVWPSTVTRDPAGIVLMWLAGIAEVTSAWKVHVPGVGPTWAGMMAPEIESVPPPAAALTTPEAQVVEAFGTAAITTPAGRLSTRVAPVKGVAASLKRKTVSVEVPPCGMLVGVKDLLTLAVARRREGEAPKTAIAAARRRGALTFRAEIQIRHSIPKPRATEGSDPRCGSDAAYFAAATIASERLRISSGDTSSTCVATYHWCPNGSSIPPVRSP